MEFGAPSLLDGSSPVAAASSSVVAAHLPSGSLYIPLIAGGVAGAVTDVTLFPLDTLKTRLQGGSASHQGNLFRGIYSGIGPAALIAAPAAASFFVVYEWVKRDLVPDSPVGHGTAAAVGETAACLVKVPFEVVKQRLQAGLTGGAWQLGWDIFKNEGIRGSYAGLGATIVREIPFGLIQMPIYEWIKKWMLKNRSDCLTHLEACACGAAAGGIAAFATCPVDVWKTRRMLGQKNATIRSIARDHGVKALFSGVGPRVLWVGAGGAMFFGVYEWVRVRWMSKR